MTNQGNSFPQPPVTLVVMISEAVYKLVVGAERFIQLVRK